MILGPVSHFSKIENIALDTQTKICSAVLVSTPLTVENVLAACVGWGKYAQIRERHPDRFSATLRAHLGLYDLWEQCKIKDLKLYIRSRFLLTFCIKLYQGFTIDEVWAGKCASSIICDVVCPASIGGRGE